MKINEITYDLREAIKEYTDDSELDDRYLLYLYNVKRAKYLRQDLNNYQKVTDNSIKQTFCVGVEEVSANECGVSYNCETLLRTKSPIPTPLELSSKVAITSVKSSTKLSKPFNFISREKAHWVEGSPYSNSVYVFLDTDGYLYLYSSSDDYKLLECITVTGIFEDPLDLAEFPDCCECTAAESPCFDEDNSEYPLQPHYIDLIRREILKELIGYKQIPEDRENDATDS